MGDSEVNTKIRPVSDLTIQIPGYKLEKLLGSGAMASVYLATQQSLERQVALKLMSASLVSDSTFRERFLKEGRIIAQLNHPHIVTIFDISVFQSCYYMAMEYINSGTLKERIEAGLAPQRAVEILCQVAAALGYAHSRGFVHRDVKPANILFREDGSAVLSDFGIAKKALDDGTQMTAIGWTVGTPNYMSPEQALGRSVDARSDLYSLGIVFYEMLTGSKPFQSQDPFATAFMHVNDPIPRLPAKLAHFQGIIDRLLAKDPKDRFASSVDLIKAITQLNSAPAPCAQQATQINPPRTRAAKPSSNYLAGGLLGFTLLILLSAGTYYLVFLPAPTPPRGIAAIQEPSPPMSSTQLLDEKTRRQVETFLQGAKVNFDLGYLIYPYTTNAAYSYCQVLSLDPQNAAAKEGLQAVAEAYQAIPDQQVNRDELSDSLSMVKGCLNLVPDHAGLLALREHISQQLAQRTAR